MATAYKVLGQQKPAAATETTLYSPSGVSSVISTIAICNADPSNADSYSIAVWPSGTSSTAGKNVIASNASVYPNETKFFTLGITLESGATIRVTSVNGTLSFSAFGSENS